MLLLREYEEISVHEQVRALVYNELVYGLGVAYAGIDLGTWEAITG